MNSDKTKTPTSNKVTKLHPKHGIGVQLIIFGDDVCTRFSSVVSDCQRAGYSYVEGNLSVLDLPVAVVRNACHLHRIPLKSIHVSYPRIAEPTGLNQAMQFLSELGGETLICSGSTGALSREGLRRFASELNRIGQSCRGANVEFLYHLFDWPFAKSDDIRPIDVLLSETKAELVGFNLDTMWAAHGGLNPVDIVGELGERCSYYHLKDRRIGKERFCPLGKGDVRIDLCLESIASISESCRLVVEQDRPIGDPFDDLVESRQYLKSLGI